MFAKTIIDSDAFTDMPQSTQNLYFHLCMRADDDGFINNPKKIQRSANCSDDDMKILCAKNFIIPFESGVIVIKHWRIHNYLRSDRYKPTVYEEEKAALIVKSNGAYSCEDGIPKGYQMDTQVRLGEDRIGEVRGGEDRREAPASPPPPHSRIGSDGTSRFEKAKIVAKDFFPPVRKNLLELRDEDRRDILATLSHYSDDEIAEAMGIYVFMLHDDAYEIFAPYASLIGFLRGGVEKFVKEAKPQEVYRKRDPEAMEKAKRDAVFAQIRKEREEDEDDE
jgi:hypothetical protein